MSRRYTLKSAEVFQYVMKNPGRGTPYGYDSLAEASGCGRGLIEKLAKGKQATADVNDAHSLVEALGVAVLVLFMPKASPELDDASPESPPHREGVTPCTTGRDPARAPQRAASGSRTPPPTSEWK